MKNNNPQTFEIGDLIVDNYKREGIVTQKVEDVSLSENFTIGGASLKGWLAAQADTRMKKHVNKPWLVIAPLSGGSILAPEGLCVRVRKATKEDFNRAVDNANGFGQDTLNGILEKRG